MNRIDHLFERKQDHILNIYFTAGFPHLDDTSHIITSLAENGVDIIEIGMPYSDPMADGPTIQESGSMALKNGMTLSVLFEQLSDIRSKTQVPLLLMGYLNQMMQYGVDRFIEDCSSVGIDGLIIPDMPIDVYELELKGKLESAGLHAIFLITPQTSETRVKKIDRLAGGFIYMVSNSSITGAKREISPAQIDYFERIRDLDLANPRLIGFGISNHQTFEEACQYANGAIIGSAFIKHVASHADQTDYSILEFVEQIRSEA
ncbi:MAG: tryptophan synthase subunit alpha [Saprospiraceae bacterium]|nr:tryptophan synthase subunit alpha [Saprospiraceae bacterium]